MAKKKNKEQLSLALSDVETIIKSRNKNYVQIVHEHWVDLINQATRYEKNMAKGLRARLKANLRKNLDNNATLSDSIIDDLSDRELMIKVLGLDSSKNVGYNKDWVLNGAPNNQKFEGLILTNEQKNIINKNSSNPYSVAGAYGEALGTKMILDYIKNVLNTSIYSNTLNVRSDPSREIDTTVTFSLTKDIDDYLKSTDIFAEEKKKMSKIMLDHKTNLNSFSVYGADREELILDAEYFLPLIGLNSESKDTYKRALIVESLYNKYKENQPYFYSINQQDNIITPTDFFSKQKNFALDTKGNDSIVHFVNRITSNYGEQLIKEELQKNNEAYDEYLTTDDLSAEYKAEIAASVIEDIEKKLIATGYHVMYTRK